MTEFTVVLRRRRGTPRRQASISYQLGSVILAVMLLTATDIRAHGETVILHFANRPEFIAADTVQKFQAETGIGIAYDVYSDDQHLYDELVAGNQGMWDLVVASDVPVLARGIAAHIFQPIALADLNNYGNLDPQILSATGAVDPGNKFGVPYLWGTAGLGINPGKLRDTVPDAPIDTLALVFDPATVERTSACGVAMEDSPADAIPAALAMLGLDPTSDSPKDLEQASSLLDRLKPYVRRLPSHDFIEALASGTICVGFGASVDVTDARTQADDRSNGVTLTYSIPKERTRMWVDMLAIPAGAAHPAEARAFINFLLRPEIISDVTDWTGAVNPNLLAADFVDDDKTDETVFPSTVSRQRLFMAHPLSPEISEIRAKIWARTAP